jgi:colanic acid biosynthesis glycosyl transferase WcaI
VNLLGKAIIDNTVRVLLISNYYYPENVGAGVYVRQLAVGLRDCGHDVTVLTSLPSYPHGAIFPEYRGRRHLREIVDGIKVVRTYTYATTARSFWPRFFSFGAFCASSALGGFAHLSKADVIYAILPPLPLGVSAWFLSRALRAAMVVNVQDIYPDIAVATGFLKNRWAISVFQRMERWIYRRAARIVVISEGFRENLLRKNVTRDRVSVVPNWADSNAIRPRPRDNAFRRELGVGNGFLVVYSGGLTHNSDLVTVLKAARELSNEHFRFAIVGDGVQKENLERMAVDFALSNVQFLPFQPLERYPEVLAAADVTLVTLHSKATYCSVPSKIYKQMAAGRAVVAITNGPNELTHLIQEAVCGYCVQPDDVGTLVEVLRRCAGNQEYLSQLGANGRSYLERECTVEVCVKRIEQILLEVTGQGKVSDVQAVA